MHIVKKTGCVVAAVGALGGASNMVTYIWMPGFARFFEEINPNTPEFISSPLNASATNYAAWSKGKSLLKTRVSLYVDCKSVPSSNRKMYISANVDDDAKNKKEEYAAVINSITGRLEEKTKENESLMDDAKPRTTRRDESFLSTDDSIGSLGLQTPYVPSPWLGKIIRKYNLKALCPASGQNDEAHRLVSAIYARATVASAAAPK